MIIVTTVKIPLYVCFVASLGAKFSYYEPGSTGSLFNDFFILFEKLKESIFCFADMKVFNYDRKKFNENLTNDGFRNRTDFQTKAQRFIRLQMKRTKVFLINNPNVRICPADKGGKTVITDTNVYAHKMRTHLMSNVNDGVYICLDGFSFDYIRKICESKYGKIRNIVNEFFKRDATLSFKDSGIQLKPEPYVISRIYGLLKIHKEGYPMRPIVSATDCMAQSLSRWMLNKLNKIAAHVGKRQLRSSHELFSKVDRKVLNNENHVLVTWDFDNMFTNIPFQRTKEIIKKFYFLIQKETSMPVEVFLHSLTFLVEENAFFTFEGTIYLQTEGLAMGNSLSQVLAEITTSYLLNEALLMFDSAEVSFMYKYVDDIIAGIDSRILTRMQERIELLHGGMKLKLTVEDVENEVDYLQMKVGRNVRENSVYVRWTQKDYSSGRILDFHSFHPLNMKVNVVKEYVKSALKLTSTMHWNKTINSLRKVLRNSNYSHSFINEYMNRAKREVNGISTASVSNETGRKKRFLACPYYPSAMNFVTGTIKRTNMKNVSLAPSVKKNSNSSKVFSNLKDKREFNCMKRSSLMIRCRDCDFESKVFTGSFDVERTFKSSIEDVRSDMYQHCVSLNHNVNAEIDENSVTHFSNEYDLRCAKGCPK